MDLEDNKIKVKDYAEYLVRLGNLENVFAFLNDYCKDIKHKGLKDVDLNESRFNYQKQQFFQGKITREAYDIQQRIIAEAIREWIDEFLSDDNVWYSSKYSESSIKLSLEDLKKQLREILNLNGPEVIFFYLDKLISEIKSVYEYKAIKRKYQILEWKSSNQRVYSQPIAEYAVKEIDTILQEEREKREKLSEDRRVINEDLIVLIESLNDSDSRFGTQPTDKE